MAIPVLILVIGSVLSVQAGQRRAQDDSQAGLEALQLDLSMRLHNAELSIARLGDLVVAAAAHFSSFDGREITDADLTAYLVMIDAQVRNPELTTGLTYIARVEPQDLQAFVRARVALDPTFPADVRIPPGQQAVVAAQSSMLGHKGVALSVDALRLAALQTAVTTGRPTMTPPLTLPEGQARGVHIFSPITTVAGEPPVGWVGSVVGIDTLRGWIIDSLPVPPPMVLFDDGNVLLTNNGDEISRAAALASVELLGREWVIAADEPDAPPGMPGWLLVSGAGLALTLSASAVSLLVIGDRRRLAADMAQATQRGDQLTSLLHVALEDGPVGMAMIGLGGVDHGRLLRVNQPLADFLAISVESLEQLSCLDILPADQHATAIRTLDEFAASTIRDLNQERQWRRSDGQLVWGQMTCSVVSDEHGRPNYLMAQVQDIDDRQRLEVDLHRQNAFMEAVLSNIEVGILACDADANITFFNTKMATQQRLLNVDGARLTGELHELTVLQPNGIPYDPHDLPLERALRGETVEGVETRFLAGDGTIQTHLTTAQQMLDTDGSILGAVAAIHDITARKRDEVALNKLAKTDYLTGLPNRMLLADRLNAVLARDVDKKGLALLFLDLDRFKLVNDSRGHEIGDRLLRMIAERISRVMRPGDVAARMGGDEFVVLAEGVSGEIEALGVADRLREAIQRPLRIEGEDIVITCSVGVVMAGNDDTAEGLLRHADLAMYRAKDDGRATVRVYEPALGVAVARRFLVEGQLREALRNDDLCVVYQPIVDAGTSETLAVEALVRWRRADQLLGPADFLDVAEDSGLIVDIDRRVMVLACRETVAGPGDLAVSVNLSSRQLANPDLVDMVSGILADTGLAPHRLCLELTETALIAAEESVDVSLHALRAMGIGLALDDFGTGYASLNYLRRFPVDGLKIDLSFVRDMVHTPHDRAIVSATIDLAREMGLATVAEGVETAEQASMLTDMGCDRLQGYLFARPLLPEDVAVFSGGVTPRQS